jgi:catechol 2,3-dioxygenase
MVSAAATNSGPVSPIGVNHIVLNVRNMEESHQFWTDVVGLRLVGSSGSARAGHQHQG